MYIQNVKVDGPRSLNEYKHYSFLVMCHLPFLPFSNIVSNTALFPSMFPFLF